MALAALGSAILPSAINIGKKVADSLTHRATGLTIPFGEGLTAKAKQLAAQKVKKFISGKVNKLAPHWTQDDKESSDKQYMDLLEAIQEAKCGHKGPPISMFASQVKPFIRQYVGRVIPKDKLETVLNRLPGDSLIKLEEKALQQGSLQKKPESVDAKLETLKKQPEKPKAAKTTQKPKVATTTKKTK